jgi:hypothetical protein
MGTARSGKRSRRPTPKRLWINALLAAARTPASSTWTRQRPSRWTRRSDNNSGPSLFLGGGGIFSFASTTTVTNSTFSNNTTGGGGGGIDNFPGGGTSTLTVTNSTFSGSSAANNAGGISQQGAAATVLTADCDDGAPGIVDA